MSSSRRIFEAKDDDFPTEAEEEAAFQTHLFAGGEEAEEANRLNTFPNCAFAEESNVVFFSSRSKKETGRGVNDDICVLLLFSSCVIGLRKKILKREEKFFF